MSIPPHLEPPDALQYVIHHLDEGKLRVVLTGRLNEDVNLGGLLNSIGDVSPRSVCLDLAGVDQINSCGIREWTLFLEQLANVSPFSFDAISAVFAEQAGMILSILGPPGTPVASFAAPYFCPSCQARSTQQLTPPDVVGTVAPVRKCADCGAALEFDGLEQEYFSFLARRPR